MIMVSVTRGACFMRMIKSTHGQGKPLSLLADLTIFFVSDSIFNDTLACNFQAVLQSDHRLVELIYKTTQIHRGPSNRKSDDSCLQDITFVSRIF